MAGLVDAGGSIAPYPKPKKQDTPEWKTKASDRQRPTTGTVSCGHVES